MDSHVFLCLLVTCCIVCIVYLFCKCLFASFTWLVLGDLFFSRNLWRFRYYGWFFCVLWDVLWLWSSGGSVIMVGFSVFFGMFCDLGVCFYGLSLLMYFWVQFHCRINLKTTTKENIYRVQWGTVSVTNIHHTHTIASYLTKFTDEVPYSWVYQSQLFFPILTIPLWGNHFSFLLLFLF